MSRETDLEENIRLVLGFESKCRTVPVASLVSLKKIHGSVKNSRKYQQIVASIKDRGIIEPPVILPDDKRPGIYYILDGNIRVEALKELRATEVECLVSTADDTYTYNKRVSRLSAVQCHRMISRAIERGASEESIAKALGLEIGTIRKRSRLLVGICNEAKDLLADKPCPMAIFAIFRQMKPLRQMEAADLMIGQGDYSAKFARMILATTSPDQLVEKAKTKPMENGTREHLARLEKELAMVQTQISSINETFGEDTLILTVTKRYLKKLLENAKIVLWLSKNHTEYLSEFQSIAELVSLPSTAVQT